MSVVRKTPRGNEWSYTVHIPELSECMEGQTKIKNKTEIDISILQWIRTVE